MEIVVHGIFAHEFVFPKETHFHKAHDIWRELFSKVNGLQERILSIVQSGTDYVMVIKDKKIHLLPMLTGFGLNPFGIFLAAVAAVLIVYSGGVAAGAWGLVGGLSAGTAFTAGLVSLSLMFSLGMTTKPQSQKNESPTSAAQRSNSFGTDQVVSQGQPIPIGYGHLCVTPNRIVSSNWNVKGFTPMGDYMAGYVGR